jgi:cell division protein FtsB
MASRPRPNPTPGSGRGRGGRRPRQGSAGARRTTLVGASAAPSPPASRAKLTGRAAILFLVMLVLAVSYASSARAWLRQRSEINDLNSQIAQSQAAVGQLEKTQRRWHDPAYLEDQARCRFDWVMPGETGYSVVDASGTPLACAGASTLSPPVASTSSASSDTWYQGVWNTVVRAGQDPAAVKAAKKSGPHPAKRIGAHVKQGADQGQPRHTGTSGR